MHSFFFWKNWTREYKTFWYILSMVFICSMILMWTGYFRVPQGLTDWNTHQNQKTIEDVTHVFEVGNFEFAVPIEMYSTLGYFNAGPLKINTSVSYAFAAVLVVMGIFLFTIITTLPRFWYYVGTGLFILFIVSLRLDVLEILGQRNFIPAIAASIVFVSVSFYFNAFNTAASFTIRWVTFGGLTILSGLVIYFFSGIDHPFLYMSVSSFIPGLILSVLFSFMIAHEIIAGFVYLTSQSSASSKSLQHFTIISLIYIVNLILTFLNEAGLVKWNFIFVNLYLLFTISALLAIWGFRRREGMYDNILPANPFGVYFIMAMGIVSFTTIGVFLHTYNDAGLKILRDVIIFSHIGFGVIFLLYFVSNFIGMMAGNKNVYKILYHPTRMPYATYRIAGLIATFAFIFYSQWHTYVYLGSAGIFNSMGDVQLVTDKASIAESYYRQARGYAGNNYHGNYFLAGLERERGNFEKAHQFYNTLNWTKPTEASLINNANVYLLEDDIFSMFASLEEALQKYPKSGVIQNNLAYTYLKLNKADSAYLLFDQALKTGSSKHQAAANILGLIAQTGTSFNADSLLTVFGNSDAVVSNALIIARQQNDTVQSPIDPLKKRELDLHSATLLNNYIVYALKDLDTTFLSRVFAIASDSINGDYSEALKATLAHAYYYQNNVARAMSLMGEVAYVTQSLQGKFNYTMGLWALEQGNPQLAVSCFAYSVDQNYKEAQIYNAIALAEARKLDEASVAAEVLLESKTSSDREIGKQLKRVLSTSRTEVLTQSDLEKYQYCRYRLGLADSALFNGIISTLENPNYKALIILEMAQRQFRSGSTRSAIRYFNKLDGLTFTDKNLADKINHFELELLASRNEVRLLATRIREGITFSKTRELHKLLYTALVHEASGDTLAAERNYEILAHYNPFFEEGVIAAARYFKTHSPDRLRAYAILAEAKQINTGSARLLMAYITEATRVGFDDFASHAYAELEALQAKK